MRTNLTSVNPPGRPGLSPARRPEAPTAPTETKTTRKDTGSSAPRPIEITIALPKLPRIPFSKLKGSLRKIPRRVFLFIGGLIILALIGLFVLYILDRQRKTDYTSTSTDNGITVTELNKGQPSYPTILPEGKSITDFGGWTRISPVDRDPVFTYVDYIGKVKINISQQPLPDSFKEDLDNQVAYLAQGFHADIKVDAGGTAVYIGTSAKGPQSVIFTKNNLLVLIRSNSKVENSDWVAYVISLK